MTAKVKKTNRNVVVQHNRLINSRHALSLAEQRIILSMVAQIKKEDKDFQTYRIQISDFVELTGTKHKGMYEKAQKITENLLSRVLKIQKPNGDLLQTHFLGHALYKKGKGYVEVSFHPELMPYLLELKNNFTSYDIRNVLPLTSKYTLRIYELLKQFNTIGERMLYVDELRELLAIPDTYSYGIFKRRILITASESLKQHTDMYFTFEEVKEGRKIIALRFTIHKQTMNLTNRPSPILEILIPETNETKTEEKNPNPLYEVLKDAIIDEHDERTYLSWFEGCEITHEAETGITIFAKTNFQKNWISEKYSDAIRRTFAPENINFDVIKSE